MARRHFEPIAAAFDRISLTAKGVLVLALPVCALLISTLVFYLFQRGANQAQSWVEHTFEVRSELRDAMLSLAHAETGLRGYLLSGLPADLELYRESRRQLPESIDALRKLVVDNPSQMSRLARLQARVASALPPAEILRRNPAAGVDQVEHNRGNLLAMDDELKAMQDEEELLLLHRTEAEKVAESRLEWTILAGAIFGLLGGVGATFLFTNSIVRRVRMVESDAHRVAIGVPLTMEVPGSDEVARLASTLKQTSQVLSNQREELQAAHAELERRVEQRTSQLKAANEELRTSNEVRQAVVQSSPLAIWALDRDGLVTFWNPAAERIFGWTEEEVVGKPLPLVPPEQQEEHERWLEQFRQGESVSGLERTRIRKDGTRIEVSIWTAPLRDARGRIRGTLTIDSDITQRRLLEEQFRQSQKLEAIGRLAGGVAHDFNNLLTVIMGYVEMLILEAGDQPILIEYAHEVQYASSRASALTAQLLAFSRRQVSQPQVLDLNDVVSHSMKLLRRVIGEDIEILTDFDSKLGKVKADPVHIDQVIMNLVVNARDAMGRGGRLTIDTANVMLDGNYTERHVGVKPGAYAMLAISDTGTGMTAEVKSRLFEPFFTTKEAGKGTGLGLSIVYGIVKQNGGEIMVYSEPGKGTTFKIYLPLVETPVELKVAEENALEMRGSETILVCEDESGIRKLVVAMLSKQGYLVLEAEHPQDALALLQRHTGSIHLLLTDIVMPQINGFELAKMALEARPQLRVLYMSGYTDNQVSANWTLHPEVPFLHKPFTATALALKVRETLAAPAAGTVAQPDRS